jgi:hypothetical protein
VRTGFVAFSVLGLVHCSSAPPPSAAPATHPVHRTVGTFEGSFDAASRHLRVAYHLDSGDVHTDAVLPYGTGDNQVFFHTLNVAWEGRCGATTLCADVTAWNKLTSYVENFTAVFDSFSRPDIVAVGAPYNYGGVDNGQSASMTWSFSDPTGVNFQFVGHAEGTVDDPGAILSATPTKLWLGAMDIGQTGTHAVAASSNHVKIENASSGGGSGVLTVTRTGSTEIVGGETSCAGVTLGALGSCLDDYRLDCRTETGATAGAKSATVTVTDPNSGLTTTFPIAGTCNAVVAPVVAGADAGDGAAP